MTEVEPPAAGDGGGDRAGGNPAGTPGGHGRATARVPVPGESQPGRPPQVKITPPDAVPQEHRSHAPRAVGCFVLTISDSKTAETDTSGALIRELLMAAGHTVVGQGMVKDEPAQVQAVVRHECADPRIQAFIMTGGTGITSRDATFEAVEGLLDKRLTGFGELFRMLSYAEIGAAAMLSRAQAGVVKGRVLFSLPGSPNACRLALEKLILPELGHLIREVSR
ncbi:MAG: MogA/MoaB family molybdenum cofactor biosynthesis protein [Candidatus Rokubacteria bacterium]|nr:MogA/MoaB family molybdenum cofactor biosynthesis protein [Candidatus Rokubacteria bacterium]